MKPIRERHHRLPAAHYTGLRVVAFTACVHNRVRIFVDSWVVNAMESILREAAEQYRSDLDIYLFMPDHLHALLSSVNEDGDVLSAMKRFKQRSNYWLAGNLPGTRWQKDFYDRIVRTQWERQNHFRYILNNPVKAGIVASSKDFRFKGSTKYDLNSM
ncbi:MAG: transposase [Bacteroidetes bacterium]|nr:transposase [Bacteroidota bacterium]